MIYFEFALKKRPFVEEKRTVMFFDLFYGYLISGTAGNSEFKEGESCQVQFLRESKLLLREMNARLGDKGYAAKIEKVCGRVTEKIRKFL